MSDALRTALCTRPRPTQPTLLTLLRHMNPVQSITLRTADACCLTQLQVRCSVSLTVSIVCVRLRSPLRTCYREKTVTLSSSKLCILHLILHCVFTLRFYTTFIKVTRLMPNIKTFCLFSLSSSNFSFSFLRACTSVCLSHYLPVCLL